MDKVLNTLHQIKGFVELKNNAPAPRPSWNKQPREMDLHSLDYDFPKVASRTQKKALLPAQRQLQSSANSPTPGSNVAVVSGFPSASKPSYLNANYFPPSQDAKKDVKSKNADEKTAHLTSEKPLIKQHQKKEEQQRRRNIVRSAPGGGDGTQLPVGHKQLKTAQAWTMSATIVATPAESMSQPDITAPLSKEVAKAQLPEFYGRNQFAHAAAQGKLKEVNLFLAAYPETDAGPGEYSPSPLIEAARNAHPDVVKALMPKASEKVQIDALSAVLHGATTESERMKLADTIEVLAKGFKENQKNDVFNAICDPISGTEQLDWVFETLMKIWDKPGS